MLDARIAQGARSFAPDSPQDSMMRALQLIGAQRQNALQQMQMQAYGEEKKAKETERNALNAFRASIPSPQMTASQNALMGGGGPTAANAQRMAPVDPRMQMLHRMMQGGAMSPMDYAKEAFPKDEFATMAPGSVRVNTRTNQPVFTAPDKQKEQDPNKPFMVVNGQVVPNPAYQEYAQKVARAGAARTDVRVDTAAKPFWNDFGKQASDSLFKEREGASAAASVLQSVQQIRQAAANGAYQGAGAELKLGAAKAMGALGMPYDSATVANSELFSAQANQFVLNSIKQLGANPSNADREFIEKTVPRLQTDPAALPQLLSFIEQKAQTQVRGYNSKIQKVESQPQAGAMPFSLQVQEPAAFDYSAADEILKRGAGGKR